MTSAIETALTELSANLRRMEQRHQATGYKFDRLYDLIAAARAEQRQIRSLLARSREFIDTTKNPPYPIGADLADEIDAALASGDAI